VATRLKYCQTRVDAAHTLIESDTKNNVAANPDPLDSRELAKGHSLLKDIKGFGE
jgi:hypothetical protein